MDGMVKEGYPSDECKLGLSLNFGSAAGSETWEQRPVISNHFSSNRGPHAFVRDPSDRGLPSAPQGQLLQPSRLKARDGPIPGQPLASASSNIYPTLWQACAGPLTLLPKVGSKVVYFPQGHLEQVRASLPIEKLHALSAERNAECPPPHIICHVVDVILRADSDTDEVFAQMTLLPLSKEEVNALSTYGGEAEEEPEQLGEENRVAMFSKALTASDTSTHGGFSVPRKGAGLCLPRLDYTQQNPNQMLIAQDFHGQTFQFRHIFRGFPRRHLLTTGWSHFVNKKRLLAGDSIMFVRGEDGQLWLGVRRVNRMIGGTTIQMLTLDAMNGGVLGKAADAVQNLKPFKFIFVPRACDAPFVIPYEKFRKNLAGECNQPFVGMRFRMLCETEDSTVRSSFGIVTGCNDLDQERFPNSLWRCYTVKFDETTFGPRLERISPWEIEALDITVMEMGQLAMHINNRQKRSRPVVAINPLSRRLPPTSSSSRSDLSGSMGSSEEDEKPGVSEAMQLQRGGSAGSEEDMDWGNSGGRHSSQLLMSERGGHMSTGNSHQQREGHTRKVDKRPFADVVQELDTRSADGAVPSGRHAISPPSVGDHMQSLSTKPGSSELQLMHLRLSGAPSLSGDLNSGAMRGGAGDMPLFPLESNPSGALALGGAGQGWDFQNAARLLNAVCPGARLVSLPQATSPTRLRHGTAYLEDLNTDGDLTSLISGVLLDRNFGANSAASPLVHGPRLVPYLPLRVVEEDSAVPSGSTQVSIQFQNASTSLCVSSLTSASGMDIPSPSTASAAHSAEGCTRLFGIDIRARCRPILKSLGDPTAGALRECQQQGLPTPSSSAPPALHQPSANPNSFKGQMSEGGGEEAATGPPDATAGMLGGGGAGGGFPGPLSPVSRGYGMRAAGFVKVHKEGSGVGRSLDLNKFRSYNELRREINNLFGLEGPEVENWMYVFVDNDGDRLLLGDDPWENFVVCAHCIHVLPNPSSRAPARVQTGEGNTQ